VGNAEGRGQASQPIKSNWFERQTSPEGDEGQLAVGPCFSIADRQDKPEYMLKRLPPYQASNNIGEPPLKADAATPLAPGPVCATAEVLCGATGRTSRPLLCADGKLVDEEAAQAGASIEATAECIMGTDHCASLTEDAQMPASVSDFQAQQVARVEWPGSPPWRSHRALYTMAVLLFAWSMA
jgi:hypothetical protein